MANEPGYKWGAKNALKRADTSTSVGQRITEYRTRKQDKVNAFGDDAAAQAAARESNRTALPAVAPKVQRTLGGRIMSQDVADAKAAFERDRANIQTAKNAVGKVTSYDRETNIAIAEAWKNRTPDFYPSVFNITNLNNLMTKVLHTTDHQYGIALLEACFKWLNENGYMEKRNRIRGEAAAKVYPVYDETVYVKSSAPQRNANVITTEERARLKAIPLDELARQARANYKKG
jgi:hypothetical protein